MKCRVSANASNPNEKLSLGAVWKNLPKESILLSPSRETHIFQHRFWAFDTEYIASGLKAQDDVCNFGFANNLGESHVFRRSTDVWKFLIEKRFRRLYVWSLKPEFGSLAAWSLLGHRYNHNPLSAVDPDSPHIQRFKLSRGGEKQTTVYDIQGFFKNMRWKNKRLVFLANMAAYLAEFYQDPSLYKPEMPPEWFGKRKPETKEEWVMLDNRVRQDARVTAKAAEFLQDHLMASLLKDPKVYSFYSWGGVARKVFDFPKLHACMGRNVFIPNSHLIIREPYTFAGRSDCFSTGALPPTFYMDVASLYPVSMVATDALRIRDVELMTDQELGSTDFFKPYCWLYGVFESQNDLWGLPLRSGERNYYVTGTVTGLYNTLDLEASKATVKEVFWGLKPKFDESREMHEKYAELTLRKLEKRYKDDVEKNAIKEVVNSTHGSLGLHHPRPSIRSNFPAYSAALSMSRLIMSRIFDLAPKPIHYMDTDSLFVESKIIQGKLFELKDLDEKITVPIILEEKGYGEHPLVFRSKHYFLDGDNFGYHAIPIEREDWLKLVQTKPLPTYATVKRQIRGTFLTRSSKAKELQIGRWYELEQELNLSRLETLFHADDKRFRETQDSYTLCRESRHIKSRSWTSLEFYRQLQKREIEDVFTGLPEGKRADREFLKMWLKDYAHEKQDVQLCLEYLNKLKWWLWI